MTWGSREEGYPSLRTRMAPLLSQHPPLPGGQKDPGRLVEPLWERDTKDSKASAFDWLLPVGATVAVITGTYLLFSLRSR